MEVKKVSVEDYRADMGLMRGYSFDSQILKM